MVEVLPALAGGPARAGEREAPDRRPREGEQRVADERRLHDSRRDGDERADDRRQPSEEDRPVLPALEPALRAVEPLLVQVEPASVALQVRPSSVEPDRPASDGADRVADRACERDGDVRRESLVDRASEEHDLLIGEGAGGDGAPVDHDHLARRRQHGVDEHQEEHGVQAVVADRGGDRLRDLAQDGGDEHRGSVARGRLPPGLRRTRPATAERLLERSTGPEHRSRAVTRDEVATRDRAASFPLACRPFQTTACSPGSKRRSAVTRMSTPSSVSTVTLTRAARVCVQRTVALAPRGGKASRTGSSFGKPSVEFTAKRRTADEVRPWSSVGAHAERPAALGRRKWLRCRRGRKAGIGRRRGDRGRRERNLVGARRARGGLRRARPCRPAQ